MWTRIVSAAKAEVDEGQLPSLLPSGDTKDDTKDKP